MMKTQKYVDKSSLTISRFLTASKAKSLVVYTLVLLLGASTNLAYAGRFDPPSLKVQLNDFDSRIESNIFNVDFLLAHIINNGRKTVREVGELAGTFEDILQNTTVFTNNNTGVDGAAAGSVIIPPGTSADTIIILNQNEGDSIAIQR